MLIDEIILENFMSYEYARLPLRTGVNVICGPNGAGKSSILLGISIALGQSHTERSRKLSNLIRWGKDQARVTISLDNSPIKGKRPVRQFSKDRIFLTRVLRRDGKYWFELDNRAATKKEVERLLAKFQVDPDNLLIIMHQNMTEQFTTFTNAEKLRTVEAAVGLESYRRNVLSAKRKLTRILREEESVDNLLKSAEQTLTYWRDQYDQYQQKKQLRIKRRFLERELVWAEASKREFEVNNLKSQINDKIEELRKIEAQRARMQSKLGELQSNLEKLGADRQRLFETILSLSEEKAENEAFVSLQTQHLDELHQRMEENQRRTFECISIVEQLEISINKQLNQSEQMPRIMQIKKTYKNLEDKWIQQLNQKSETLKAQLDAFNEQIEKTNKAISESKIESGCVVGQISNCIDKIIESKIEDALLNYRMTNTQDNVRKLHIELETKTKECEQSVERAKQVGSRIASTRDVSEILDEIRLTDGYLAALSDISEDVEQMYESYSRIYLDLKEKAQIVAENRSKTLKEVDIRMKAWRDVMGELLREVEVQYQEIISHSRAVGNVRLTNGHDIETAGLEIAVGFKGAPPVPLDAYTQSGGERSLSTISFLLSLQQHVKSPFRAVDEYDVHMDPKNRETITSLLIESVNHLNSQYLLITPSQITFAKEGVHLVIVQNMQGRSELREAG